MRADEMKKLGHAPGSPCDRRLRGHDPRAETRSGPLEARSAGKDLRETVSEVRVARDVRHDDATGTHHVLHEEMATLHVPQLLGSNRVLCDCLRGSVVTEDGRGRTYRKAKVGEEIL